MNDQRHREMLQARSTNAQWRACDTKKRFPSKKQAHARARLIGGTMTAYRCPSCRHWHVGHSKQRATG